MDARGVLVAVVVVTVLVGAITGVTVGAPATEPTAGQGNETSASPGEYSVAVVAVEQAAVEGLVERRRFQADLRDAPDARARAHITARYLNASRDRLDTLERQETELNESVASGSMSRGTRAARAARLAARATGIRRLAADLRTAAAALPQDVRRDAGIRLADIRRLSDDAAALTERNRGAANADATVYVTIERMVTAYNERGEPEGLLADQLRGEAVNLHVNGSTGNGVVSFRLDQNGRMTEVRAGPRGDATVRMDTDRRTVERVATDDEPAARLREATDAGDVTVSGIGPVDTLKWTLVDLLDSLGDLF